MYGIWGSIDYNPEKFSPNLNTEWRKKSETLTWKLISFDENEVILQGPSGRPGIQRVSLSEFKSNWIRA